MRHWAVSCICCGVTRQDLGGGSRNCCAVYLAAGANPGAEADPSAPPAGGPAGGPAHPPDHTKNHHQLLSGRSQLDR
jgi:hypothetical protein